MLANSLQLPPFSLLFILLSLFVVVRISALPIKWRRLMGIGQIFSLDITFVPNTASKVPRVRKYSTHFSCIRKIMKSVIDDSGSEF